MSDSLPASIRRIAGATLLAVFLFGLPPLAAEPGFSGAVQDTLGNVLAEVEVLVIAPATTSGPLRPVATVRTDVQGRFLIERLEAGAYQIAAIKRGYHTYIGQIDTQVDRWIQLVLHPQAGLLEAGDPLPEDPRWALRLPRRNILRETEPVLLAMDTSTPDRPRLAALPIRLKVDQLFKVATDLQRAPDDEAVVQGMETRLEVAADLGTRGRLAAEGSRERLANSRFFDGSAPTSRARDHLRATASYETSIDTRLNAEIDYARRGASWDQRDGYALALDHEQNTWHGAVGFEKQLDAATSLLLAIDYAVSDLSFPGVSPGLLPVDETSWQNRAVDGSGRLARTRRDGQRFELDFHVRHLDLSTAGLRATAGLIGPDFDGLAGWTATVRARETRDLSNRFSLTYGVGVRHALRETDVSLVTPHLGGRWQFDPVQLHVLATYFGVGNWSDEAPGTFDRWKPRNRVGFEAAFEVPLGSGLTLSGSHESAPLMADRIDRRSGDLIAVVGPIYVTDGNASRELSRITLTRESPALAVFAEIAQGEIDGTVAAALPYDLPFQELSDRNLAYHNGRIGLRFVPQGTLVTLELRQVQESRNAVQQADSAHRFVEFTLSQDLMRRDDLGHWRFLMGLRMAELTSGDPEDLRQIASPAALESTDGRLTAGLSVEF